MVGASVGSIIGVWVTVGAWVGSGLFVNVGDAVGVPAAAAAAETAVGRAGVCEGTSAWVAVCSGMGLFGWPALPACTAMKITPAAAPRMTRTGTNQRATILPPGFMLRRPGLAGGFLPPAKAPAFAGAIVASAAAGFSGWFLAGMSISWLSPGSAERAGGLPGKTFT